MKTLGIHALKKMQIIEFTKLLRGSIIETQSKLYNIDPTW